MKLISCDSCNVVLDGDKLCFPHELYDEYGVIDDNRAIWDGDEYVAYVKCPLCAEPILEEDL